GQFNNRARAIVLPSSDTVSLPSNSPITPSTIENFPAPCLPTSDSIVLFPISQASRFRDFIPLIRVWYPGSIKSGPTLKGWIGNPLSPSAPSKAQVTAVFPSLLLIPATIIPPGFGSFVKTLFLSLQGLRCRSGA